MAVTIDKLLAPDAAALVRRWAQEMNTTEGDIVTQLVRHAALIQRARHSFTVADEIRSILDQGSIIPFGKATTSILTVINSRGGLWSLDQIRKALKENTDYYIRPGILSSTLSRLRDKGKIERVGWNQFRRVEKDS